MKRTEWLQETRKMRFKEAYEGYRRGSLTQAEAALLLGVCNRTFRRYMNRYDEGGMEALLDKRLVQVSHRRAPVDEVMRVAEQYRSRHKGWNAKHFYAWHRKGNGSRSYIWAKNRRQEAGLVERTKKRGTHRKRRERAPLGGMMVHQDGSTHEWVLGQKWDLIVTPEARGRSERMFRAHQERLPKGTGISRYYRYGGSQSLRERSLYACFQCRIYAASSRRRHGFRALDWRAAYYAIWMAN